MEAGVRSRSLCRLCLEGALSKVLEMSGVPRNIQHLLRAEELASDRPIDLGVMQCSECGFVQIPPQLDASYYDDYVMGTTHSPQMQAYQRRQAVEFVDGFGLRGKQVFEAGCGDGNFLDHLVAAGAEVSAIEPSGPFRELALARGHRVEGGYLTRGRVLNGAPFDGFATRQVLEHVPDIHGFLSGIRENLRAGAVGLIEVPSLEKAIADHRFYDFFTDHVNYFSMRTLSLAAQMNGFEVLQVKQDMFDEYNVAIVRNSPAPELGPVQATVSTLTKELRREVQDAERSGRQVVVWGAGGKGLSVLAAAGLRKVHALIDSDVHKQGRFTPVTHLKVEAPSREVLSGADLVIVTAMAYHQEIVDTLRFELGYSGRVLLLGRKLMEVRKDDEAGTA